MDRRDFDTRRETKTGLSEKAMRRQTKASGQPGHLTAQRDPMAQVSCRLGDTSCAGAHASTLNRFTTLQPASEHSIRRLQRSYGNRYVQRVVALAGKGQGEAEVAPDVDQAIQRARGGGQSLDSGVRSQMEKAFDADFSGVRVHADAEADALNRSLNARAFTTGTDIFFSQGAHNPGSSGGRELLAHELTHVVQQTGDEVLPKLSVGRPGDRYEQEADRTSRAIMEQEQQFAQKDSEEGGTVRRQAEEEEEEALQTKSQDPSIYRQPEEEEEEPIQAKEENGLVRRQGEGPEEKKEEV
jgi:hypothetical protein